MIKIEFLYFDGCPNHEQALQNLKTALKQANVKAEIESINIKNNSDAINYRFLGSPSIRINGHDLEIRENGKTEYAMNCRRYQTDSGMIGYPPLELILAALRVYDKGEWDVS